MDRSEESDSLRALGEKYNRYTWQKLPAKIIRNGTGISSPGDFTTISRHFSPKPSGMTVGKRDWIRF